jgi:hypothetical protein
MRLRKNDRLGSINNWPSMRWFVIFLLIGCSAVCNADTTIKMRTVFTYTGARLDAQNPDTTRIVYYRSGAMRKKDSLGDKATVSFSSIANCEAKTGLLVDFEAREYRNYRVVKFWQMTEFQDYLQKSPERAVPIESSTIDTGERKTFFGHAAKHLVTTNRRGPDKGSNGGEEIFDGWYIDHEGPDNNCAPDYVHSEPYYVVGTMLATYPDVAQFHHTGPLPTGLAVKLTYSLKLAPAKDGSPGRTTSNERTVEELSDSPLNPSLFELPPGFHENPELLRGHSISRE